MCRRFASATLPQGRQASRYGGVGLLKPSRLPWIRKGGCRKMLPVCHCLALVHFTLIRLAFNRFAAFAHQLAVSPQGHQPSRCGGASAPTMAALFE